jgi:hypothetical protein
MPNLQSIRPLVNPNGRVLGWGMAKSRFDWVVDTRLGAESLAPLTDWDEMATHATSILERSAKSTLPIFCQHAGTIYEMMDEHSKEGRRSAVLLAQHQRLEQLLDIRDKSNFFDFYLFKFPAWLAMDWLCRREERRNNA